jgi:hypothetical protein
VQQNNQSGHIPGFEYSVTILVQIIWHTRSFLAVPADPGKRLKLHIASEYAFPKPFSHPIRNWCAK